MPMYDLRCFRCGKTETVFRKIINRDLDLPNCPSCFMQFTRIISPARILSDIVPYESPKTGKWITSRSEQREDLKVSGSFLSEPGVEKDIARNSIHAKERAFAPVAKAVDETVSALVAAGKLET